MSILKYLAAIVLATTVAGCIDSPTSPSDFAPYSQEDLIVGTGLTASVGATAIVNYTGWFYDGSKADHKGLQFETTTGAAPIAFTIAEGLVIDGWVRGVPGMMVGGVRRLVIPPSLAYGNSRTSKVPADSTLIFEIELVGVQ